MQKFDLEALHWRSSTDRQSTWPRVIFGLFGDIFTLNADYIAWKLLKMALEVEYMMDFYHPGLLVTDLHLRSSTDRQSTWPRVIFGKFGDIFTLQCWLHCMETIENGFGGWVHDGVPASRLTGYRSSFKVIHWPPKYLTEGHFWPSICLFVNKITQKLTDGFW